MQTTVQAAYIHIPFCLRRCHYCSFVSYDEKHILYIDHYLMALQQEINEHPVSAPLNSLYIGGGTPSLLQPKQVKDLVDRFTLAPMCEVTMEANPGTLSHHKLTGYLQAGINRLSIGIQSFNDDELGLLGRLHNAQEAQEAVLLAKAAGFRNINIDLMYGLPGQKTAAFRRSLRKALKLEPTHLSLYALSLEENCQLWQQTESGQIKSLSADGAAVCYEEAGRLLHLGGYQQYEISNWALPAFTCQHNLNYWQQGLWAAYGLAACAFNGRMRTVNEQDLKSYIRRINDSKSAVQDTEEIKTEDLLAEGLILALRLNTGADLEYFSAKYGLDVAVRYKKTIKQCCEAALMEQQGALIRLTARGRLLSNEVFWRFLP